jgi:hypothetical protein
MAQRTRQRTGRASVPFCTFLRLARGALTSSPLHSSPKPSRTQRGHGRSSTQHAFASRQRGHAREIWWRLPGAPALRRPAVTDLDRSGLGDCCCAGLAERVLPSEELAEREPSCEVPPGALGLHVKEMSGEGGVVVGDDEDEGLASTESYILIRSVSALSTQRLRSPTRLVPKR